MNCKEAQSKSSVYLDGELTNEQSSAVRGHLRECGTCEGLFEDESTLLDLSANLGALDPPSDVWERISQQIAAEEIADSHQSVWRRWLSGRRIAIGVAGTLCAAAAAALVLRASAPNAVVAIAGVSDASVMEVAPTREAKTVAEAHSRAIAEAEQDYQQTIIELRELLEEDRSSWSASVATAVDDTLAGFRREAAKSRFAIGASTLVASRDPIYETYRAEISFLQLALAGSLPSGAELESGDEQLGIQRRDLTQ